MTDGHSPQEDGLHPPSATLTITCRHQMDLSIRLVVPIRIRPSSKRSAARDTVYSPLLNTTRYRF